MTIHFVQFLSYIISSNNFSVLSSWKELIKIYIVFPVESISHYVKAIKRNCRTRVNFAWKLWASVVLPGYLFVVIQSVMMIWFGRCCSGHKPGHKKWWFVILTRAIPSELHCYYGLNVWWKIFANSSHLLFAACIFHHNLDFISFIVAHDENRVYIHFRENLHSAKIPF